MKSQFRLLAPAVIVACIVLMVLTIGPSASAHVHAADAQKLTLVHQDLALAVNADLVMITHPSTPLAATDVVRISAYQPITDRDGLRRAIAGSTTKQIDRVELDPSQPASIVTVPNGDLTITVRTESDASSDAKLRLSGTGLYPVVVEIVDGAGHVSGRLVTFVDRLPAPGTDPAQSIGVALIASITAPPSLPGAKTPLPPDVTAALNELQRYRAGTPLSLSISPEILGRIDPAELGAIATVLVNGKIMSRPSIPLDPSAATAAQLDDSFIQRLFEGEKMVADNADLGQASRTVWFAPHGITNPGALLLRKLGVQLLVVTADQYLHAVGNNGPLTDYSQLFQTVLSAGGNGTSTTDASGSVNASGTANAAGTADTTDVDTTGTNPTGTDPTGVANGGDSADNGLCAAATSVCIPTAAIDPALSARLTDSSLSDEQAALYTAADLVAYRDFFADSLSPTNRHALLLGLEGDGVASAARITRTVDMAEGTGAATFITIDRFQQSSGQSITDGRPTQLQFPQQPPLDLRGRVAALQALSTQTPAVESMLVEDNGRTARWSATIQTLYSSSITDADANSATLSIENEMAAIKACIVAPATYTFTLTGGSSSLPLRLTNNCGEPLKVSVHLEAAAEKMEFPLNDAVQELPPHAPWDFTFKVIARTNGTFDVTFDVFTPKSSNGLVLVTPSVTIKARINALTGLPQVLTGAGLLILLTWWVRNLRRARRARRSAAATSGGHPVLNPGGAS